MEVEVISDDKESIEVSLDSLTVAEVLREYLNMDDSVSFVAWRRDHPIKPLVLRVETKGKTPRKAIQDAIDRIEKESEKLVAEVKKS